MLAVVVAAALLAATPAVAVAQGAGTGARAVAVQTAAAHPAARELAPDVRPRASRVAGTQWRVRWARGGEGLLEVVVDVGDREVIEVWRGAAVDYPMARGYEGWFGGRLNALWIWIPLCIAFLFPFFDRARPLRLLHVDLLAILGLSASLAFFNHGELGWSVPLVYGPLGYLLVRALQLFRRASRPAEQLVPHLGNRALAIGLVLLVVFRVALNVGDTGTREYVGYGKAESHVVDVGLAGVAGADRLVNGLDLYSAGGSNLDTYGPLNYLAYVPFEAVWPFEGAWDELPAAHAAALTFDLAAIVLLLLLGRRLRAGADGRRLGLALAYGWAACPWTAYVLASNTNDALVGALVAALLLAWGSPVGRGVLIAAGTTVKFASAALLPLAALARGRRRDPLLVTVVFAVCVALLTLPFVPDGGLREVYDATVGYQLGADSPFSVWGRYDGIGALHTLAKVAVVALALGVALAARRRRLEPVELAAAAAAVLIALQLIAMHWIYFYVAWFLPPLLVALFVPYAAGPGAGRAMNATSAGAANQAT